MALELYMAGVITKDIDKSREFYQRLGLAIPAGSEGQKHVGVKMESGLTFFLNSSGFIGSSDTSHVVFEFYLADRAAVDEKHKELTGFGYQSRRAPLLEEPMNVYFALIDDPDGNIIMLTAD